MIKLSQDLQEVRREFFSVCKTKKIPTHNKAALLYQLSIRLEEKPDDEQIRQLLLLGLADYGILLGHFWKTAVREEEIKYQEFKRKYMELVEDDKLQRSLFLQWKEVQTSYDSIPQIDAYDDIDEMTYETETNRAVYLYRKFMGISEKNSPELYHNLHRFICMTRQAKEYRLIAPLFLFQLMVRHTGRLAVKENLDVSLKSLWDYKEYRIEKDNGKNFRRYKLYARLFCKLCKEYQSDTSVNLALCAYGFGASSNLVDWIMDKQYLKWPPRLRKTMTPLCIDLLRANMSSIEIYEPEVYSASAIFGVSQKEEREYIEDFQEDYEEVEQAVTEYVLEHIEYVLFWMEFLYVDTCPLQKYVKEIYKECIPKLPERKLWMEKCIQSHIYEIVQDMLDRAVRAKVVSVVAWHETRKGE